MELAHPPEQATGSQGLWAELHGSSATLLVPLAARARAVGRWPALGWQDPEAQRIAALAPQDLAPLVQDDALVRSIVLRSQYIDQQVVQACAQGLPLADAAEAALQAAPEADLQVLLSTLFAQGAFAEHEPSPFSMDS